MKYHIFELRRKIWSREVMIEHRSYTHNAVVKLKPEKIQAWLNGIRTHDLCDTGAVLNWKLGRIKKEYESKNQD